MATVFWYMHGVRLMDFTPRGAKSSATHYHGTLTGLKQAVRRKGPALTSQGALPLHDNAQPHIAPTTVSLLDTWHWEIHPCPPCSPDLAPLEEQHRKK
jgi:hypothetical protein